MILQFGRKRVRHARTQDAQGLRKRVKITGRGKVKRHKSFTGHLLSGRPSKTKRKLRRTDPDAWRRASGDHRLGGK